ncbi:MAG: Ribosomal protein large subunit ribosomal protein [Candidatus Parcubacteria bacterium]|jgi:large subunit ribosomal protein L3
MKFILAKKIEMSQRFKPNGTVVPVTLLEAGPCVITQIKTKEKDGYDAVQIGFETKKNPNKPELGHTKGLEKAFVVLKEFRLDAPATQAVGDVIDASTFATGDFVEAQGVSKGKGFQGVVKRHGFRGGPASHGHKDNLRMPGSIGAGGIQKVFKGMRMGGRMGTDVVTVKNLEIVEVDAAKGIIAIKGAVPGARGAEITLIGGHTEKLSWN